MKNFKSLSKSASRALTALVFVAAVSTALFAAAPAEINYQGKLTDSSGIPFNGTKNVTFSFWNNPTVGAGAQIGSDVVVNNVSVVNGVFNAVIDVSGIPFVSNPTVYLQVRIDGSNFGPTRQKLVAAPFALAVAAGAVSGGLLGAISDGTIDANDLAADAVNTVEIVNNAVTGTKLSSSAGVDANRAVGTDHIKDGAVTSAKLAAGIFPVSGGLLGAISDGTIDANDLAADAVNTVEIVNNAVTGTKLSSSAGVDANRAVGTDHIKDGAVTSAKLAAGIFPVSGGLLGAISDGTIDANDLAADAVNTVEIVNNAVTGTKLSSSAGVDANRAVGTDHIKDGAVTSAKLAAGIFPVSGGLLGAISDGTIDANDLAADAVNTVEIVNNAVTGTKLSSSAGVDANRAVGTDHIKDGAVTSAKVLDGTLKNGDFSSAAADALAASKVKGGTFASGTAFVFPDQVTMQGDLVVGSGGTALAKYLSAIRNYDVPNLAADASDTFTITVTGAAAGDGAVVTPPNGWAASLFLNAFVSGANTVTVTVYNAGSGTSNPGAGDFRAMVFQH
jgi:hypothetical protein